MSLTSSQLPLAESPPGELLCEKCRGIPWDIVKTKKISAMSSPSELGKTFDHYKTFHELDSSADQGCPLCQNFRVILLYDGVSRNAEFKDYWSLNWLGAIQPGVGNKELQTWKSNRKPLEQILPTVQRLAPDTLEDDLEILREKIDQWLTACTMSGKHKECTSLESCTSSTSPLPTRLIDVGTRDEDILRLVESQTQYPRDGAKPLYLTLSYRWGEGNRSARTTLRNVQQRNRRIYIQELPKTIQDAIIITRRMKIRYLWVDAVCIIQPDNDREREDWLKESANMANYYHNAYLCIAASSAEDSSEGILVERLVAKFPFREWRNPGGRTLVCPHYSQRPFSNPLLERGWCLQEWILSPRILHWTKNGLIWQCKEGFFWESQKVVQDECPEHIPDYWGDRNKPNVDCLFDMNGPHGSSTEIWRMLESTKDEALGYHWKSLIESYSRMNLTKPGDRLAAIQGIATYLSDRHKVRYLGGIFERQYLDGLLWTRDWPNLPTKIEDFPSWCWASANGVLHMPRVDNANSIPWMRWVGGFSSGTQMPDFKERKNQQIRVTAPLVPLDRISWLTTRSKEVFNLDSKSPICPGEKLRMRLDYSNDDLAYLKGACMLFVREQRKPLRFGPYWEGIIVKQSFMDGDNVYQRIGKFDIWPGVGQKKLGPSNLCLLEDLRADIVLE